MKNTYNNILFTRTNKTLFKEEKNHVHGKTK
jgi:hypothetical protein